MFKRLEDGRIILNGAKHLGENIIDVARTDPNYLRFAWRDCGVGLPPDLFSEIVDVMKTNGVPFARPRKK
jgi:hypothetical protein